MAASIDDVLSTTVESWADTELADNVFGKHPLLKAMYAKGKGLDGGTFIWAPVLHGASTAVDSYTGYDVLDVSAQQGLGRMEFNWKQYGASIAIDGFSELRNAGISAVIDLLEEKTQQAEMSLKRRFNTDLYGDGTGNGAKNFDGLSIAVDSTGTYGGFLRSTYTWNAANETAVSGALTIAAMRTMFNNCGSDGFETPDMLIGTQSVFEAYEGLLQPDMRFSDNKMADGGFKSLTFKDVPIVFDGLCTSQTLYMLNTKYLSLRWHNQRKFKSLPFVRPANQDAKVSLLLFMGNLIGNNSRRQGKLTAITS